MTHWRHSRRGYPFLWLVICCLLSGAAVANLAPSKIRTITVKVVADQNFARQDAWQRIAAALITEASQAASDMIEVRLKIIEYAEWQHPDDSNLFRLTDRLISEVKPGRAEIVIGLTLSPRPSAKVKLRTDGATVPFRGMMIVTYQGTADNNLFVPYIMVHELVHLFGGIHTHDRTLMAAAMNDTIVLTLDSINAAIMNLCHDIDFAQGYSSLTIAQLTRLAGVYELAKRTGHDDAKIDDYLVTLYPLVGRVHSAELLLRHLLATDSSSAINWLRLGDCYIKEGLTDSATAVIETALDNVANKGPLYRQLAVLYFNRQEYGKSRECAALAETQGAPLDSIFWRSLTKAGYLPHR